MLQGNHLQEQAGVDVLVEGVKLVRRMLKTPSRATICTGEVLPGPQETVPNTVLEDYVRAFARTVYHPVDTCRYGGVDERVVVDLTTSVRGVDNLFVSDASIMPPLVTGNTHAPKVMIAERCAGFLL